MSLETSMEGDSLQEHRDAERSLAHADLADSADRSAALWLRSVSFGVLAAGLITVAVLCVLRGAELPALISLAGAWVSARRVVRARREEARVFRGAVKTYGESQQRD
jgi:hypothetical protein